MWSFRKYTDAGWTWRRQSVNGFILEQSLYYFDDLDACKLDAQRYGYAPDQPSSVVSPEPRDNRPDPRDDKPNYPNQRLSFRELLMQGRVE